MLKDGLYEQLVNNSLQEEINSADRDKVDIRTSSFAEENAPEILSRYVANVLKRHLTQLGESEKDNPVLQQLKATNRILTTLQAECGELLPFKNKDLQLDAVFHKENSILSIDPKASIIRPETSLVNSSLFTGADKEPQMFSELKKEILSCNRISMLVSFIKWSGLRILIDELREFTQNGGTLQVATTSYMGATDAKAIEELSKLPNTEIKISYDTTRTRLHAKAYLFERDTGFTTAYVGSSNMSNAALSSGLEWNLKITQKSLPEIFKKIRANFELYWNSKDFEPYTNENPERLKAALGAEKNLKLPIARYAFEIRPFPFQQEILDNLQTEREIHGRYRNLVVAATGTGKTVISALDYKAFCKKNPKSPARLLFVAHREEILEQSIETFRAVLKDPNFGEMLVGSHAASGLDHLFISIQTFNSKNFSEKTSPDFYDYIVIDEFHHAAAPSYQKLLGYYHPRILLGLTATPERMDGQNILEYFGGKIAAEIRLPEAIDRKLLSPFEYFGVTDTVDLSGLKWSRGGYDKAELENVYTMSSIVSKRRAELIANSVLKYVADIEAVKGLGFCVTIAHAKFMSEQFNSMGIASMALSGKSDDSERLNAKKRIVSGELKFIFVVDLYNEGVDIPEINTVLFLRPTESLTVFLQQLGRGLRLSEGKDCLTVLDFIGQANKRYNFEEKFRALLSHSHKSILHELEKGFLSVPKGCYIQLEKKASEYIFENIRSNLKNALVERIRTFEEDSGLALSLSHFLEYHHLSPARLYKKNCSFSRLCVRAGISKDFNDPDENLFSKALGRFSQIDSRRFIRFILEILDGGLKSAYTEEEKRLLQMLRYTLWGENPRELRFDSPEEAIREMLQNKTLCRELRELLKYNFEKIDFIDAPLELGFACPLDLYCSYSRDQILVACDFMKPSSMREGVKYLPEKHLDLLFVTLNKSEKDYSETTLYNDYSISETLFHWQSQSTTSDTSETGKRYINGHRSGNTVVLFVRESKKDDETGLTPSYTCLGKAVCVAHEGSSPINITWELEHPIPAKYLKKTNKLMVG